MHGSATSPSATTSPKLDPFGRRESYHRAPLHNPQAIRRQDALNAQQEVRPARTRTLHPETQLIPRPSQRRRHAIEEARSTFRELDIMDYLSLAGSSDSSDTEHGDALPSSSTAGGDAATSPPPVIGKTKRQRFKPRFVAWAKNLLSHAETLDLRHGLPEGLESEWRAVVVPKGKRCLCATSNSTGPSALPPSRAPLSLLWVSFRRADARAPLSSQPASTRSSTRASQAARSAGSARPSRRTASSTRCGTPSSASCGSSTCASGARPTLSTVTPRCGAFSLGSARPAAADST